MHMYMYTCILHTCLPREGCARSLESSAYSFMSEHWAVHWEHWAQLENGALFKDVSALPILQILTPFKIFRKRSIIQKCFFLLISKWESNCNNKIVTIKKYTNVANPYTFPIIWRKLKKEEGASFKFVFALVILLNGVYCKFLCWTYFHKIYL